MCRRCGLGAGWGLAIALGAAVTVPAQHAVPSTNEALAHVRENVDASNAALPNIFCDEKIDSREIRDGKIKREMTLAAVMRVTRNSDGGRGFKEERSLITVDGKPARKGKQYKPPFLLFGGFGQDFKDYLSSGVRQCNVYRLETDASAGGREYVLEVSVDPAKRDEPSCNGLRPQVSVKFRLNPDTFEIDRFEELAAGAGRSLGFGDLHTATDYAMVPLGPKSFLIPVRVHAVLNQSSKPEEVVYDAEYSNCHRFGSTMTILPAAEGAPR